MMVDYGLTGKIAAVTGAGSGIGRETAVSLAGQGAKVVLIDYRASAMNDTEKELKASSEDVMTIACDVRYEKSVNDVVRMIVDRFGRIDIMVNNAGIEADREPGQMGGDVLMTTSVDQYHKVLDTNLIGHFNFMRAVIPHMKKNRFGRIVNISSVTAFNGVGTAAYVASKAGVIAQTKAFARQFGPDNIIINTVCPGMIDTPMHDATPKENFKMVARTVPLRRVGKPGDVAKLILFLAQEDIYMTGETIAVDGGGSMR